MQMLRYLVTLILALALSFAVSAQEDGAETGSSEVESAASTPEEEDTAEEADEEEDVDDADLDEQTYEEDEDDFIPTEEIPADEPIPFPTNI